MESLYVFTFFLTVVAILAGGILSGLSWETDQLTKFSIIGLICILLFTLSLLIITDAYKTGQVDALTGKVNYQLVVEPDSTRSWKPIK